MDKEKAVSKVRNLFRLAASAGPEEADTARGLATKIIVQYNLTEEDYQEKEEEKPIYTEDNLFFETKEDLEWPAIVALAIGNKYDCLVIKEDNMISNGEIHYKYFVYGENSDILRFKELFTFLQDKLKEELATNCFDKSSLYTNSWTEGWARGVQINIEMEDFRTTGIINSSNKEDNISPSAIVHDNIEEINKNKADPPIKARYDVSNKKDKQIDIIAYFKGEGRGRQTHIGDPKLDYNDEYYDDDEYIVQDYSWLNRAKTFVKNIINDE